jgi:hypothetical protein
MVILISERKECSKCMYVGVVWSLYNGLFCMYVAPEFYLICGEVLLYMYVYLLLDK